MQRFFELSHDLLERAAHAIQLDFGSTPNSVPVPH
jgi:hypothetical protein